MSELLPLSKEQVEDIKDFCKDFDEPYRSILFGKLVEKALLQKEPQEEPPKDEAVLSGLSDNVVRKTRILANQVQSEPGQLRRVYEFEEENATVIVSPGVLGDKPIQQMRNACLLLGVVKKVVYDADRVTFKELRKACDELGVLDPAHFARDIKRDSRFGRFVDTKNGEMQLAPRVVAEGREFLRQILNSLRTPEASQAQI